MPHRLALLGLEQTLAYLQRRPHRLAARARSKIPTSRQALLQDRAALFWLCRQARDTGGPLLNWAVLPPAEPGGLPRIHAVAGEGIGLPIGRHESLRARIAFSVETLQSHGPLWLPWPLGATDVDAAFGQGAWQALCRERSRRDSQACRQRLDQTWTRPRWQRPRCRL